MRKSHWAAMRGGRRPVAWQVDEIATVVRRRLRAEPRRELAKARDELMPLLTPRQRARLILMGYLD